MLVQFFLRYPVMACAWHLALGALVYFQPLAFGAYYTLVVMVGSVEIVHTRDRANLAAYYTMYVVGLEILNRMGASFLFWEFGKYAMLLLLGLGSLFQTTRTKRPLLLVLYFLLLLPGVLITAAYGGVGTARIMDLTSQYLSGSAALAVAGWYFYRSFWHKSSVTGLLSLGILPIVALVALLFMGKSVTEINYMAGSNFEASGGFGPNQVSSVLGWGMVLLGLALVFRQPLTGHWLSDALLLVLIVFRGLLTFSRGGMLGAVGAMVAPMAILWCISSAFRQKSRRLAPKVVLVAMMLTIVATVANQVTNNVLLYRYQGKSTAEILFGQKDIAKAYFSGRESILEGEWDAFVAHPILGIGLGRGTIFRERQFHSKAVASHTEFTRMLGEHGLLGLLAMFIAFLYLPWRFYRRLSDDYNRQWMLTFYLLAMVTMFHSGMRLTVPCMAFGLAFIAFQPTPNPPKA